MKIKKGMILAAGFGKRLQPLTKNCPKPLLEVHGIKLLEYSIKFLLDNGISEIIINTHYLHEQINEFIKKHYPNIAISHELEILDTGGGILNALSFFKNENFIVLNSDTVWVKNYSNDLKKLIHIFEQGKNKAALMLATKENSFDKNLQGDFDINNLNFLRKSIKNYIYTGCQILNPIIFKNKTGIFSMNIIWDELIKEDSLNGLISSVPFLHATDLNIFNQLNSSKTIGL